MMRMTSMGWWLCLAVLVSIPAHTRAEAPTKAQMEADIAQRVNSSKDRPRALGSEPFRKHLDTPLHIEFGIGGRSRGALTDKEYSKEQFIDKFCELIILAIPDKQTIKPDERRAINLFLTDLDEYLRKSELDFSMPDHKTGVIVGLLDGVATAGVNEASTGPEKLPKPDDKFVNHPAWSGQMGTLPPPPPPPGEGPASPPTPGTKSDLQALIVQLKEMEDNSRKRHEALMTRLNNLIVVPDSSPAVAPAAPPADAPAAANSNGSSNGVSHHRRRWCRWCR